MNEVGSAEGRKVKYSRLYEQVRALQMDPNEPWDPTAIAYRHGRNDVIKDVLRLLDEHRLSGGESQ